MSTFYQDPRLGSNILNPFIFHSFGFEFGSNNIDQGLSILDSKIRIYNIDQDLSILYSKIRN